MSGVEVARGIVVIDADAGDVPNKVARDIEGNQAPVERSGRSIGKSIFGGVTAAYAAIGGAQAVTGFFGGAITGASDLNETLSKSSVIFGDSAGAIESFGLNAAKNVGMSREAAIAAAAGFGDMFTQIGYTSDQAAAMSQQVVIAAADLGSFSNLDTADVADRMSAAFRGEYDSLQAVIPNINAARVESEALAATGKTVASELTAQEKAAAVLAIVQKDGARAMGDFARTSDGAANKSKILAASFQDQQTKLGGQLMPLWQGFLGFLSDSVLPTFSSIVEWTGKNGDTMLMLAGVIGGAALAYYGITTAMGIYRGFQIASAAANGTLTVTQWALNAALSANPIGIVITLIAALVAGIIWVATQTTFFQDAWSVMTTAIGTAWNWLWTTVLSPVFSAIGAVFTWIYESIIMPVVTGIMIYVGLWAAVITWLWQTVISPVFRAIGNIFSWIWGSIISPIVGFIQSTVRALGFVFSQLYGNFIKPAFDNVAAGFRWVWGSIIQPIVNFIRSAIRTVGDTVNNVFGGIASFIGQAFRNVVSVIRGPINGILGLINSAINGVNGISVTIPDWVPVVGGNTFGVSIPTIPLLATGTNFAPDAFIAGERGPELITGARGATVRPYDDTLDMLRKGAGGSGVTIYGDVVLDAKNVREWQDVVDMLRDLDQTARAGKGNED
jgi:hypothetical protein